MFLKFKFLLWSICIILFFSDGILAQQKDTANAVVISDRNSFNHHDSISKSAWINQTSVFLELLGKSFYSVNVDFRKKETAAVSVGLTVGEGVVWPSLMYYRFGGMRRRFELGGGISSIFPYDFKCIKGVAIHGVVGYRYQKKNGLIFRIGFTPLYGIGFGQTGRKMFVPWPGISFGYCY